MRMATTTRWRRTVPWLAAAWVLVGASVCEAQLFPNLPIRREKVDCAQEAPFHKLIRQQYYGYYPTCWRSFPPGWMCPCPNPNAPNWEAAKRAEPLQTDKDYFRGLEGAGEAGDLGTDEGTDPTTDRPRDETPPLPRGGSPFDLDPGPVTPPPGLRDRDRPGDMSAPGRDSARRRAGPTTAPASAVGAPALELPAAPNPGDLAPIAEMPPPAALDDPRVGPTSATPGMPVPADRRPGLFGQLLGRRGRARN